MATHEYYKYIQERPTDRQADRQKLAGTTEKQTETGGQMAQQMDKCGVFGGCRSFRPITSLSFTHIYTLV